MNLTLAYLGHSGLSGWPGPTVEPNLKREAVSFDTPLLKPIRFRETHLGFA
jgi:hypothetical protein